MIHPALLLVLSTPTAMLTGLSSSAPHAQLPRSGLCTLTPIRDIDGDGIRDLVLGVPDRASAQGGSGAVAICSSKSLTIVKWIGAPPQVVKFGYSCAVIGDKLFVGAPAYLPGTTALVKSECRGAVASFSMQDWTLGDVITSTRTGDAFGHALGMLERRGSSDTILITAPAGSGWLAKGAPASLCLQVSLADGSTIRSWTGKVRVTDRGDGDPDHFGYSLCCPGDLDGDEHADFVVGAPWREAGSGVVRAGSVSAFSGKSGKLLWEHVGTADARNLGIAVLPVRADTSSSVRIAASAWSRELLLLDPSSGAAETRVTSRDGRTYFDGFGYRLRDVSGTLESGSLLAACCMDELGCEFGSGEPAYLRVYESSTLNTAFDVDVGCWGGDIARVDDVDGDRTPDYVIAQYGDAIVLRTLSGKDRRVIKEVTIE